MSDPTGHEPPFPADVAAIEKRGFVVFKGEELSADFRARFDENRIPVVGIRHVRLWGIQVDDERALPGRERTSTPENELWEIRLRGKDGSVYEVESHLVVPAPD